jgi:hypothetical protein
VAIVIYIGLNGANDVFLANKIHRPLTPKVCVRLNLSLQFGDFLRKLKFCQNHASEICLDAFAEGLGMVAGDTFLRNGPFGVKFMDILTGEKLSEPML